MTLNGENYRVTVTKNLPIPCQNTMGTGLAALKAKEIDWTRNKPNHTDITIDIPKG